MSNQKNKIEDALSTIELLVQRWCVAEKDLYIEYFNDTVHFERPGKDKFQEVINKLKEVNNTNFFDDVPKGIDQAKSYLLIIENVCQEVTRMQDRINSKIGSQTIQHIWLDLYAELHILQTHLESEIIDLQGIINLLGMTESEKVAFAEFSKFFLDENGKIDESKAKKCLSEFKEEIEQRGCLQLDAERIRIIFLTYANYGNYLMLYYGDKKMRDLLSKLGVEVKEQTFNPNRVEKTRKKISNMKCDATV